MNFGRITTMPCVTEPPPVDNRCDDRVFALTNPDACPATPRLLIKPGIALTCVLGSLKFSAATTLNGVETEIESGVVFNSSDPNIMVVGAQSGNATGLSAGSVTISASYQGMTAFADVTVLAGTGTDCCSDSAVAMMVVVDRTKSMSQAFNATYATKLAYAKAAATRFISEVNQTKDTVGLMQFTDESYEILSALTANRTAVGALVSGIAQTQQSTSFADVLSAAITELNASAASRKMIVLISDGQNQDVDSLEDALQSVEDFKSGGGIVLCLGVRAAGVGYSILSAFSTGGFLLNAHNATASISLDYLSGLKGYVCAGNCAPTGDEYLPSGQLNYNGFENWDVVDGHVDLIGNGFMDLLPGNGLYVDMAGSRSAYKGKMVSKSSYAIEEGKTYSLTAYVAGNQRVNASTNSIRLRVFSLNSDGVTTPSTAPTVAIGNTSGSAAAEIYEYAYSYQNANGETPISPASDSISTGGAASFEITITAPADVNATICRFWKRLQGTATWYLIGESDAATAEFVDTLNNATLNLQLANGTLDAAIQPTTNNLTGTAIVHVSHQSVINDYAQGFTAVSVSFSAPYDADVYLSIQQTDTPAGYDATGLLVDRVRFSNATDLIDLLDDDFDGENVQYIPPACGIGTTPLLVSQNCYSLNYYNGGFVEITLGCEHGCGDSGELPCVLTVTGLTGVLDGYNGNYHYVGGAFSTYVNSVNNDFPTINYDSGVWILDADSVRYQSPTITGAYTRYMGSEDNALTILVTGDVCRMIPEMTSNTEPSGIADAGGDGTAMTVPWLAFDKSTDTTPFQFLFESDGEAWISYQFESAKIVRSYSVSNAFNYLGGANGYEPTDWVFQGSNNGSDWTTLDTQSGVAWSGQQMQEFTIASPGSYSYYRLLFEGLFGQIKSIGEVDMYGDGTLESCSLVPEMTSNTDPSGEATSIEPNGSSEAFHAFDGDSGTAFVPNALPDGDNPAWIMYEFPTAKTVRTYFVTNDYDFLASNDGDPDNWILEGSNTGTAPWDELAAEVSVSFSGQQRLEFAVGIPGSYKFYRLSFQSSGAELPRIQALEFVGEPCTAESSSGTVSYCLYNIGYVSGYNCYGEGCLDEPPAAQTPDPSPLPDVEAGFTPPQTFQSTKQYCANCASGFVNPAQLEGWGGSQSGVDLAVLTWTLPAAAKIVGYAIRGDSGDTVFRPADYSLQASNDGVLWTEIDSQEDLTWFLGETKYFDLNLSTAYKYFRLVATDAEYSPTVPDRGEDGRQMLFLYSSSSTAVCKTASATSESSQADADAQALALATSQATTALNCVRLYVSTRSFTAKCATGFGADATRSATRYSLISQEAADSLALTAAQEAAEDALDCTQSNNTQAITINDRSGDAPARATPYPSVKYYSGTEGEDTIAKVTVTLNGFTHEAPKDVDIILVSPSGTAIVLMSDCGDGSPESVTGLTLTFDDDAASQIPALAQLTSGTWKPNQAGVAPVMPSPCPAGPYGTTLADFIGGDPVGPWQLFIADDTALDAGQITGGWTLNITLA